MNINALDADPSFGFNSHAYQQSYPAPGAGYQPIDPARYQQSYSGNGNMMQSQMQPSYAASSHPYTSGPYNNSVPAQAPAAQQTPAASHVLSPPPQRDSPDAAGQRNQPQPSSHTPPTKYPMAAPPLPLTPNSQQNASTQDTTPGVSTPKSPQSPGGSSREAARVTLLLAINRELLEEVNRLQEAGKGGAISQQQVQQFRSEGKPDRMASEEYIQCLRRVQANFTYLMPKAQTASGQSTGNEAKQLPGPAHMTAPPHMPEDMKQKYEKLRELFPEWQGLDHRMAMQQQQQNSSPRPGSQPGAANGAITSTSTTPTA